MPRGIQLKRNTKGLRPLNTIPADEARAIRSKGGQVRAEQQKQERTVRDIIRKIMESYPQLSEEEAALVASMGLEADGLDNLTLGVLLQVKNMRDGHIGAFEMLMEQGGYIEPHEQKSFVPVTIINNIPRE